MKKTLVAAFLLLTNLAIAQMPEVKKGVYVTDFSHTLTTDQVEALTQRATEIYNKSHVQLIIVIMDALPANINVNDATNLIDDKWNTSSVDETNRLIYIAGLQQHGHRIKAVRGVEAPVIFNQKRCTNILKAMTPYYDKKDYYGGLQLMADSVSIAVGVKKPSTIASNYSGFLIGGIFIACVVILFVLIRNRKTAHAV
jgi:uncharacterized membrane protein YgcG